MSISQCVGDDVSVTDLNLWRIAVRDPDALTVADVAAGLAVEFGTHDSGYPFTTQVKVGATVVETSDQAHSQSDGLVPGVDRARGFQLFMAGVTLGASRSKRRPWVDRMDEAGALAALWQDPDVRATAGRVAGLVNVDRGRVAFGRPRDFTTNLERARHGWVPWEGGFTTMHPGWFGANELVQTVTLAAGPSGGFTFPLTFPAATTAGSASPRAYVANTGDLPSWARYTVTGPILDPVVDLLRPDGAVVWTHRYVGELAYDQTLTVDTRPWSRVVLVDGSSANGNLRGTALARSQVPVGNTDVRLRGIDPTGTSRLTFRYRTGHAHL